MRCCWARSVRYSQDVASGATVIMSGIVVVTMTETERHDTKIRKTTKSGNITSKSERLLVANEQENKNEVGGEPRRAGDFAPDGSIS